MEGIRRALVLGLVSIADTTIKQAPSVGPQQFDLRSSSWILLDIVLDIIGMLGGRFP